MAKRKKAAPMMMKMAVKGKKKKEKEATVVAEGKDLILLFINYSNKDSLIFKKAKAFSKNWIRQVSTWSAIILRRKMYLSIKQCLLTIYSGVTMLNTFLKKLIVEASS